MNLVKQIFHNLKKYREPQPVRSRSYVRSGGSVIDENSAMRASAYYRGVVYVSSQLAKMPFRVRGKKGEFLSSPVSSLIELEPNPETTSFMFRLMLTQQAINHGTGYAEIERNMRGEPIALWPIKSTHVMAERDADGNLFYRIVGGGIGARSDAFLRPKDMLVIPNLHTHDGIHGLGLIDYAREVLGIAVGADKFANSLYANSGMPAGILKVPGRLDDEGADRLKESWKNYYGGRKVGGVAVLEQGTDFEAINWAPDVLQFIETRKMSVEDIARFLGVPPSKLYSAEAQKFRNIEHGNIEVITDTIGAWVVLWEQQVDIKLLNKRFGGRTSDFDMAAMYRGDLQTTGEYYQKLFGLGAKSSNEIRRREGDPDIKDGDRYYIATNNFTPLDRMDEKIDAEIKSGEPKTVEKTDEEKSIDGSVAKILRRASR